MKRLLFLPIVLVLVQCLGQTVQHIVVISVDGFRPDFYLDPGWQTPTIKSLMKEGTYARGVNSVFPSMTYPAHTTIISGVQPAEHGIYYNAVFEPTGPTGKI